MEVKERQQQKVDYKVKTYLSKEIACLGISRRAEGRGGEGGEKVREKGGTGEREHPSLSFSCPPPSQ